jgi:predicted transcriptional regulator
MGSKEKKGILVVDDPIMQDLRNLAESRGTTMRFMVTNALKRFIKEEKAKLAAEVSE